MVLRKPYAFLIKYFKLIHLVITGLLIYLAICNRNVYVYIKLCISDNVNRYNALSYINNSIYFFIILGIGLFGVIYWLLKYKNKPKNIYILAIAGYLLIGIFMFTVFNYLKLLPNEIINQKTIRLYKDFLMISLLFQYAMIAIMFVRGLGFDIKKFNFSQDLQELNIDSTDSEEVEVNIGVDTTNVVRGLRKRKREFGYFFQEFKIYIIPILAIIILIAGYNIYNSLSNKYRIYKENDVIGNDNYITIKDAYYNMSDGKNYVVIKIDIFRRVNLKQSKLNFGTMILEIDKQTYTPNKNICSRFKSLGVCYKNQSLTSANATYILVYQVDKINAKKSYFVYSESLEKSYKVKLNLDNFEE